MADSRSRNFRVVTNNQVGYIDGSAARQAAPVEVPQRREKRYYESGKRLAVSPRELKRQQKALKMSLSYVIVMCMCCLIASVMIIGYIEAKNDVASKKDSIAQTQKQIAALRAENDNVEYDIISQKNVEYIVQVAVEQLGMIQATQEQVSFYNNSESQYMMQFKSVPKN